MVGNETLAREGLRLRLSREAGFEVGECANGVETRRRREARPPLLRLRGSA